MTCHERSEDEPTEADFQAAKWKYRSERAGMTEQQRAEAVAQLIALSHRVRGPK